MSGDPTDARRAIAALLEPTVAEAAQEADLSNVHQLERLATFSQAVSLRRIADLLEVARVDDGTETVITLPQILLRSAKALEGLPDSVYHAISNALIEDLHRRG